MATTATPRPRKTATARKTPSNGNAAAAKTRKAAAKSLLNAATTSAAAGELPLDSIDPRHFSNPRGEVDVKSTSFLELVASIKDRGVLQPIVVGPALVETGKHPIVAGWRRYNAALKAKLKTIPVRQVTTTAAKEALVDALAENVARDDMTPLAEARAIDTLMREHGYTQVAAGKAIGMAERTVRERVRLLKIHKASPVVGEAIDRGAVPMDAAVLLQQVATFAPKLAAALAAGAEGKANWTASDLAKADELAEILNVIVDEQVDVGDVERVLPVPRGAQFTGAQLPLTDEQHERWARIEPLEDYSRRPPMFDFSGELDEIRAANALLEISYKTSWGYPSESSWIRADYFTADRLEKKLEKMEKAGEARLQARENKRKKEAVQNGKATAKGLSAQEAKAAAETKAKEERERELAHFRNVILGERTRGDTFPKIALTLEAAKFFALLMIASDHGDVLGRGIRYCDPEHLTETEQKNGKIKRAYKLTAPGDASIHGRPIYSQLLEDKVHAATTPEEALAPVLRAYLLAITASEAVTAQSNRAYFHLPYGGADDVRKQLNAIAATLGLDTGLDDEAQARADAPRPGKPLSEVLEDEPATSPVGTES